MDKTSPLTRARKRKGKNQDEFAQLFDVTQATISNWESGASAPDPAAWPHIAEVYGVSLAKLLEFFTRARAA